jgi:hypothetical protein
MRSKACPGALRIYPDPASDIIFLAQERPQGGSAQIMDALGHVLMTVSHPLEDGIDVSGLASGTYCVRLLERAGMVTARGTFMKR